MAVGDVGGGEGVLKCGKYEYFNRIPLYEDNKGDGKFTICSDAECLVNNERRQHESRDGNLSGSARSDVFH